MDIEKLLCELTLEEKIALVSGRNFMNTNPVPRLGIPSLCFADGPHGLRKQIGTFDNGVSTSEPSTAFPTAAATASGWNPENTRKMGEAIGRECRHYGVEVLLGPGANIKRNPLCGRSFEYFSEDPYLSGKMGAGAVSGIQSSGVGVSLKHFAANNSENYRFMGESVVDMRALREVYLKSFEYIVKESSPATLMCAYNKIYGEYCSENAFLLTEVLRDEWKFEGLVMSDWGATRDRCLAIKAGLDLEMPGDTAICRKRIFDAINSGELTGSELDRSVRRVLELVEKYHQNSQADVDFDAHHRLAAEIAEDSAVLLKNDGILPLSRGDRLLVVGEFFEKMRYQGAGSSMINPTKVTSPKAAFDRFGVDYIYARGYEEYSFEPNRELISEAVSASREYDKVLVFAGLTDYIESESADRENMSLPKNQLALIDALVEAGKKVAVVLFGGGVCELPFNDSVSAILCMFLPGQNGGEATYNLLFGNTSPSGKLAETWPKKYSDVPFGESFGVGINELYKESIFVGYRYYETAGVEVAYPFGYGLSYTSFAYENMRISKGERITVTCDIINTGDRAGAEVAELYVKAPRTDVFKPEKELRAFAKVYLEAGERRTVELSFEERELAYYDVKENRWVLEGGEYEIQIASDVRTVRLSEAIVIEGELDKHPYSEKLLEIYSGAHLDGVSNSDFEELIGFKIPTPPPKLPIHLESRFSDLKSTIVGKILFSAVLSIANKNLRIAKRMPDGEERQNKIKGATFLKRILESNSLRCMSMSEGRRLPYNFAEGFVELSNGHILRGAAKFLWGIRAPKLPTNKN